jgi:hypothetical protein
LLNRVDEKRHPRTSATVDQLLDRYLETLHVGRTTYRMYTRYEDGGLSDQAFEIADLVEHLSVWLRGVLVTEDLLRLLMLDPDAAERVRQARV